MCSKPTHTYVYWLVFLLLLLLLLVVFISLLLLYSAITDAAEVLLFIHAEAPSSLPLPLVDTAAAPATSLAPTCANITLITVGRRLLQDGRRHAHSHHTILAQTNLAHHLLLVLLLVCMCVCVWSVPLGCLMCCWPACNCCCCGCCCGEHDATSRLNAPHRQLMVMMSMQGREQGWG